MDVAGAQAGPDTRPDAVRADDEVGGEPLPASHCHHAFRVDRSHGLTEPDMSATGTIEQCALKVSPVDEDQRGTVPLDGSFPGDRGKQPAVRAAQLTAAKRWSLVDHFFGDAKRAEGADTVRP